MTKARLIVAVMAAVGAIATTGCGSSSSGSDGGGNGPGAVIKVGRVYSVGPLIVNEKGITVYEFRKDKGTESECYDDCEASISPVLTNGPPRAEGGAIAAKLGTAERRDGKVQVTYAGHPLYTWSDEKPGQARGRSIKAFDAKWYPLRPSGKPIEGF